MLLLIFQPGFWPYYIHTVNKRWLQIILFLKLLNGIKKLFMCTLGSKHLCLPYEASYIIHSFCIVRCRLQCTQQIFPYHSRTANSTRDDDRDEVSSTVSYLSDISGLSELSGQEWKPMAGRCFCIWQNLLIKCN
jgi:hypothetical protein